MSVGTDCWSRSAASGVNALRWSGCTGHGPADVVREWHTLRCSSAFPRRQGSLASETLRRETVGLDDTTPHRPLGHPGRKSSGRVERALRAFGVRPWRRWSLVWLPEGSFLPAIAGLPRVWVCGGYSPDRSVHECRCWETPTHQRTGELIPADPSRSTDKHRASG